MLDFSVEMPETSQLNLVMGVGTQTQKMMDYCNTPVQLYPGVIYGSEQQQQRKALNINKRNLLKRMTSNIKKYNALVQIVQEMNNLVSDAKQSVFGIRRLCKCVSSGKTRFELHQFVCRLIRFESLNLQLVILIKEILQMNNVEGMQKFKKSEPMLSTM
ncbi:hypothetical protein HanIR_Chr05g0239381 [Helianthus annuus]|nr:hypothetical protein HanIR_Chr05g0239381 [Helianthus annuus]